ncbi:MAG: RagB/SusD family nutrient uptake outer membrane protein [Marinilabiliaceae bacterium]
MKRIGFFILASVLLMGCEDFLEDKPLTYKTSETFPQTADDAKQMMAGIYTTMNNEQQFVDKSYFFINEVASDDKLGGGGTNDLNALAIENLMYDSPEMLDHMWEQKYKGIYRANYALEQIDLIDDEMVSPTQKDQYRGEALFFRAWFYYQLATTFGEVPLTIDTEYENLPAAPADELYGQMASDLKKAIEVMPEDKYYEIEDGRVTRWAAEALMARIYLFYTGFYNQDVLPLADGGSVSKQEVIDWLQDCIDNSGHELVDDFHELWPYTNSETIDDYEYIQDYMEETGKDLEYASDEGAQNPETMFMIKFSNYADWDVPRGYSNQYQLYFALRGLQPLDKTFPFAGGWGQGNSVPKSLVDQWQADEPDDPRLWASIIDINKEVMDSIPNEDYPENSDDPYVQTGYLRGQWDFVMESNYWGKKIIGITAEDEEGNLVNDYSVIQHGTTNNNQLSHIDDLVYIRFADVLLMMSELTEDAQYMNQVRERAGLDPVSYSLENIQKERRYELAFEGVRWNDMRRWGDAYTKENLQDQVGVKVYNFGAPDTHEHDSGDENGYAKRYDETRGFFPIPEQQIELSDGQLEQVDGFKDGNGLYTGW